MSTVDFASKIKKEFNPFRWYFESHKLSDMCACYYVALTAFARHWDIVRSDDEEKFKLLPKGRQLRPVRRLFRARRWIEKGFKYANLYETIKLGMFYHNSRDLIQKFDDQKEYGYVLDFWQRPTQDKIEFLVAFPGLKKVLQVTANITKVRDDLKLEGLSDQEIFDQLHDYRWQISIVLNRYKEIKYIARVYVRQNHFSIELLPNVWSLRNLEFLLFMSTFGQKLCKSILLSGDDIDFSYFPSYENPDENSLSILSTFALEPLCFKECLDNVELDIRLKKTVCYDRFGREHEFIALFQEVRRLVEGHFILCLIRRTWNGKDIYLLRKEMISEESFLKLTEQAMENEAKFRAVRIPISLDSILENLPKGNLLLSVKDMSNGQQFVHPKFGLCQIAGTENNEGTPPRVIAIPLAKKFKESQTKLYLSPTQRFYTSLAW